MGSLKSIRGHQGATDFVTSGSEGVGGGVEGYGGNESGSESLFRLVRESSTDKTLLQQTKVYTYQHMYLHVATHVHVLSLNSPVYQVETLVLLWFVWVI